MKKIILKRFKESSQGILGHFVTTGFEARTIELPWKDNLPGISCIPLGTYKCDYRYSPKFKEHYEIANVICRNWVLIHSGNFAGDEEKGFKTHSHGCIIIGKYHGKIEDQDAVLLSRTTLRSFVNFMEREPFELEVQ